MVTSVYAHSGGPPLRETFNSPMHMPLTSGAGAITQMFSSRTIYKADRESGKKRGPWDSGTRVPEKFTKNHAG